MTQKVAILGLGIEGRSAYRYFHDLGAEVTVFHKERPAGLPAEAGFVQAEHATDLRGYDIVVRSPAVDPKSIQTDGRITTVVKEFFSVVGPERIIGVTGSKGKGTTASLIYEMLKNADRRVHLAGNIGVPALDLLPSYVEGDYVVLELSSFQLWDLGVSPHIALLLMMEPEHLDVHASVEEYVNAKANITSHQNADDVLIYLASNELTMKAAAQSTAGHRIPYAEPPGAYVEDGKILIEDQEIMDVKDVALVGAHNLDNACAAITATWQVVQHPEAIAKVLREFKGLPHRLQFVAEVGGVKYYDDSIATTPGSAIAALRAFQQPKVIILGGSDKGADFTELAREIAHQDIRGVVLIGALRDKICQSLLSVGVDQALLHDLGTSPMTETVHTAADIAHPGDVVVMSPACASFGMFQNYKDRGDQFVNAVNQLVAIE